MTSYGLIAGVTITEQRDMRPGLLCDLFALRRDYDDMEHGLKREKEGYLDA